MKFEEVLNLWVAGTWGHDPGSLTPQTTLAAAQNRDNNTFTDGDMLGITKGLNKSLCIFCFIHFYYNPFIINPSG